MEYTVFKANLQKNVLHAEGSKISRLSIYTSDGLGPQPNKIEDIDSILIPTSSKQLKKIPGMVNFYQDVFKRRNHILALLNNLAAATAKQKNRKKKA